MDHNAQRISFRLDFSAETGLGHVIRCGALSSMLRDCGWETQLITSTRCDHSDWRCKEFSTIEQILPSVGPLLDIDRRSTEQKAHEFGAKCIVVDHYGASSDYLSEIKAGGFALAVIDDTAERNLKAADWLLNQNCLVDKLHYELRAGCVTHFGPSYALLRRSFVQAATQIGNRIKNTPARTLITLGGGNTASLAAKIFIELNRVYTPLEISCVADGPDSAWFELEDAVKNSIHQVDLFRSTPNMIAVMEGIDLAICAAGSTCWELCCLGVPMVLFMLAPNQRNVASTLDAQGCAINLGEWKNDGGLPSVIESLVKDSSRRRKMSSLARQLVDGQGAIRAAKSLIKMLETSEY